MLGILLTYQANDVGSHFGNVHSRKPPPQWLPVWSHQELLEVPLNVVDPQRIPEQPFVGVSEAVAHRWAGILQEGEKGLLMVSVHITSFKQLEIWNEPIAWADVL